MRGAAVSGLSILNAGEKQRSVLSWQGNNHSSLHDHQVYQQRYPTCWTCSNIGKKHDSDEILNIFKMSNMLKMSTSSRAPFHSHSHTMKNEYDKGCCFPKLTTPVSIQCPALAEPFIKNCSAMFHHHPQNGLTEGCSSVVIQ